MAGTITASKEAGRKRGLVKLNALILCHTDGVADVTVFGEAFGKVVAFGYIPDTLATGVDITVTDTETGASLIVLTDAGTAGRYFRPSAVITDNVGAAVTAAVTAVDVNRDIYVSGKLSVAATGGGSLGTGSIFLVVDENGL